MPNVAITIHNHIALLIGANAKASYTINHARPITPSKAGCDHPNHKMTMQSSTTLSITTKYTINKKPWHGCLALIKYYEDHLVVSATSLVKIPTMTDLTINYWDPTLIEQLEDRINLICQNIALINPQSIINSTNDT